MGNGRGFNFFLAVKMLPEGCKFTGTYFTLCPTYVPSLELVAFCLAEKKDFSKFSKISRLSNFSLEYTNENSTARTGSQALDVCKVSSQFIAFSRSYCVGKGRGF